MALLRIRGGLGDGSHRREFCFLLKLGSFAFEILTILGSTYFFENDFSLDGEGIGETLVLKAVAEILCKRNHKQSCIIKMTSTHLIHF
jgi:hypothetical protein